MLAYAAKKGWKKAFLEKYDYPEERENWDEGDEENYALEVNAWSQLALLAKPWRGFFRFLAV
jgi:hypothetical protein